MSSSSSSTWLGDVRREDLRKGLLGFIPMYCVVLGK